MSSESDKPWSFLNSKELMERVLLEVDDKEIEDFLLSLEEEDEDEDDDDEDDEELEEELEEELLDRRDDLELPEDDDLDLRFRFCEGSNSGIGSEPIDFEDFLKSSSRFF
jgi:hypothetical protein